MTNGTLQHVDPRALVESPTNPRKGEIDVSDLVESVKAQGVLEPLLARLVGETLEIVCGHRRRTAAIKVGLHEVPVLVREGMTDADALEAQIVENRDRENVHPMQEAEAYEALLKLPKADGSTRSVEDVAARVGVTVAYLTRRLALSRLDPDARDAFRAGRLETSVALILATLRKADQKRAVVDLAATEDGSRGAIPYRAALEHVRRSFLLRLADAPFSLSAEDLVPGVGPCGSCPKRTGSNPNLFGEFEAAELCTDPGCHSKKVAAGWDRLRAAAEAQGREVLGDKAAADVFRFGATTVSSDAEFVDLDDRCLDDPKERTFREILGDKAPPSVLARDGRGGVHDLLSRSEAKKAVRAALPPKAAEKAAATEAQAAKVVADEAEEKVRAAIYKRALSVFSPLAAKSFPVRIAVEALILRARETRKTWLGADEAEQEKTLAALKAPDLCSLALDASLECVGAFDTFMRGEVGPLEAVAKAYGVDLKKIRAEVAEGPSTTLVKKPASKPKAGPIERKKKATKPKK